MHKTNKRMYLFLPYKDKGKDNQEKSRNNWTY